MVHKLCGSRLRDPGGVGEKQHMLNAAHESILYLQTKIGQTILGQEVMIERLLLGLLANGNLLVEGLRDWRRPAQSRS